jgi:transposase-like protein
MTDTKLKFYENSRKTHRPDYNTLNNDIELLGYVKTGKKYGVSDNAIRKWIKFYQNYKLT